MGRGMNDGEMTFWEHLDELRGVVMRMGVTVMVAAVGLFSVMPMVFDRVILAATRGDFALYGLMGGLAARFGGEDMAFAGEDWHMGLINTELASQLYTHISVSCQLAVVLTFPLLMYLLWGFISPALYPVERRRSAGIFVAGCLLFYVGLAVGYWIVFPLTLRFLADYQLSEAIVNTITLGSYMDNFTSILFVMGVVFEIPVIAWGLGKAGVIDRGFFSRFRRHAVTGLVIAAAVITPTSDPFTLAVVFFPLYLLWEVSSMLVPRGERVVRGAQVY